MTTPTFNREKKWAKVLKSGLNKFIKGFLPQNLFSPLLNTLSQMTMYMMHKMLNKMLGTYSEPRRTPGMGRFAAVVKAISFFHKRFHPRHLTVFLISPWVCTVPVSNNRIAVRK